MKGIVATAVTEIDAPPDVVWRTLTDPAAIKQFMFGTTVETDWQPGSPIVWRGEYQGKAYEDKGELIAVAPGRRLEQTHFSPLSGQEDIPENYHTLVYTLDASDAGTALSLTQDNNAHQEAADHAQANWEHMLSDVKKLIEERPTRHDRTMPTLRHGKICHIELPATDPQASAAFYERVFGWNVRRDGRALVFDDPTEEVSGHWVPHRPPSEPGLLFYLWVDDVAAAIERVIAEGCELLQPIGADPGEMTARFRDPGGNVVGLYQEPR